VTLRRAIGRGLGPAVRLVPAPAARLALRAWALGVAQREPASALRELIRAYDDLYRRIDHTAIAYDGGVHAKHRLMAYHDFFVDHVRPGERVLDVGCGKAELAYDLVKRAGAHVTGIDVDREYLRFAKARFADPRLELVEADATAAFPAGPFDVVVLSNVLEHIERRTELLDRIVAEASPDRILIRVPMSDRDWLVPLRAELGLPHFLDPTHEVEYTEETFAAELHAAGMRADDITIRWGEIWAVARVA
jgi:2-polyprenyl-3-methyl-5-hydroxy-6-metoxy-1,4-benzoquinol methylase